MSLKRLRIALWMLVGVAGLGLGALSSSLVWPQEESVRPTTTIGGHFTLIDEDGRRFTTTSLSERPFAVYFGFTHCPDICPTAMLEASRLLADLGDAARDFRILFVTVDPARDTPDLLKLYTESFDPRIIGLTGTEDEVATVARLYRAYYRRVPTGGDSYTMDHTVTTYLMNGRAEFVGTIAHGEAHDTALVKLTRLLNGRSGR